MGCVSGLFVPLYHAPACSDGITTGIVQDLLLGLLYEEGVKPDSFNAAARELPVVCTASPNPIRSLPPLSPRCLILTNPSAPQNGGSSEDVL